MANIQELLWNYSTEDIIRDLKFFDYNGTWVASPPDWVVALAKYYVYDVDDIYLRYIAWKYVALKMEADHAEKCHYGS